MKDMSPFKLVLTAVFAVALVLGVAIFALTKTGSSSQTANLVVWGTISDAAWQEGYDGSSVGGDKNLTVTYVEKEPTTFDADFVEALANGEGPDVVILREDSLYKHRNKLFVIPYDNFSLRDFKDRFIEEGELFLSPEGVLAFPFVLDPMVMYWNRDMFSNNGIAEPPKYWEEISGLVGTITKKDTNANITQSTIAMGGWQNITNAKEVLAMLMLQAGTPITSRGTSGSVTSVLNSQFNYPVTPSHSAVSFYTQFSNPTSPNYTWNRSLSSSLNLFLSGNLALYIGFASELFSIQDKNSNLNFDVTSVPQIKDVAKKTVFGHMYALAITKQSKQINAAFVLLNAMTEQASLKALETVTTLPPVRRDLVANKPTDAFRKVFYDAALLSRSWIDPDPQASSAIFRDMIESIESGRSRQGEALNRANEELIARLK
jgi:ABC-type glycerol-3-phosphate transport system substrate-binding protein